MDKEKKKITLLILLLSVAVFTIYFILNQYIYGGIFGSSGIILLLLHLFAYPWLLAQKEKMRLRIGYIINIIILAFIPILIIFNIPKYTYKHAKQIIVENEVKRGVKSIGNYGKPLSMYYSKSSRMTIKEQAYLIQFTEDGIRTAYFFNPNNGQYEKTEAIDY